jgi:acid phosphatase (class A)
MKRLAPRLLLAVVLSIGSVAAAEKPPLHFIAPGAIDLKAVLPPPPGPGSPGALADLETVLRVQATRTPNDISWARLIERDEVFLHAQVLGPWFNRESLPVTAAFLKEVSDDMYAVSRAAKELFPRPRPPRVDASVIPCVNLPESGSYPSGHSMQAYVWAAVLSEIFPDRETDLMARAHQAAWGRVIGGVHFPSDTIGGRFLADAIIAELRKNPAYRSGIERCRAEVAALTLKKAA